MNSNSLAGIWSISNINQPIDMESSHIEKLLAHLEQLGYDLPDPQVLEQCIWEGTPQFTIEHQRNFGPDRVSAELVFQQDERSKKYYLARHRLRLEFANGRTTRAQVFWLEKGHGVTLEEGYHLLCGRSVYKERITKNNERVFAWMALDLSSQHPGGFEMRFYYENYGFDLQAALKEVWNSNGKPRWNWKRLTQSLKAGREPFVYCVVDGEKVRCMLRASPKYKRIYLNTARENNDVPFP